jgi:hypothetical protein
MAVESSIDACYALLITPNNNAIIAITNSMCINPGAWYAKTPIAHPMTSITAIMYSKLLIFFSFKLIYPFY